MKNKLTTIYIVRHGQTEWNIKGLMQGHGDSPLTPEGITQAQQTAQILKSVRFDEVFSSDLLRAKRTAEIIMLERNLAIKTTQALRERHYGIFENKHNEVYDQTIKKLDTLYKKRNDRDLALQKLHGVETTEQSVTRLITFVREIAIGYQGKTVLIVSHGGVMRYFLIRLGFGTNQTLPPGSISNASYFKLESDGVDFFIKETSGINKIEKP